MRPHVVALLHAGYWTLYVLVVGLLLLMLQGPDGKSEPLARLVAAWPLMLLSVAPAAVAFYAAYGPLFSRFLAARRIAALVVAAGIATATAAAFGLSLASALFGADQPAFSSLAETTALAKRIMTLETFGELERRLPADAICRVHKSYMVRLDRIDSIEQGRIRIGDQEIPISETYRDRLFALIGPPGHG